MPYFLSQFVRAAVLGLLLLTSAKSRADNAEDVVLGNHPEYLYCQTTDDCAVILGLCDEWRLVNRQNEGKLANAINYLSVSNVCNTRPPPTPRPAATCSPRGFCKFVM